MISLDSKSPVAAFRNSQEGQMISPADKKEKFNNKEVGDVLNKVADPNWRPNGGQVKGTGSSKLDKDSFIKLFLTQLKNQDPTNPLQNHELAAQLAQFTSLEKLENINQGVGELSKSAKSTGSFELLNMIGKHVKTDSRKITRTSDNERNEISFSIKKNAKKMNIKILDGNGVLVKEIAQQDLKPGRHTLVWDGTNDQSLNVKAGQYRVAFDGRTMGDKKVLVDTSFSGAVSGVNFTKAGPVLIVGSQRVNLSDVKEFSQAKSAPRQVDAQKAALSYQNNMGIKK